MPPNKISIAICQQCGAEYEKRSAKALYCPECRKQRCNARAKDYRKRQLETNADKFRERRRKANKKWRDANPEKMYQAVRRNHDRYNLDPEYVKRRSKYNKAAYARRKGDVGGVIENFSAIGSLQECERLHVVALHLPCGQREECFMGSNGSRCPKCPANAKPPDKRGSNLFDYF